MTAPSPCDSLAAQALVLNAISSMVAFWDRDLRCGFANLAYEKWFGVNPHTLIGTTLAELLGPELFALNKPHIDAALNGHVQVFERLIPGPDGIIRPRSLRGRRLFEAA